MNMKTKTLNEINCRAKEILFKEMGIADTIRFLNQFYIGHGDYTRERREWLDELTLDDVVSHI